MQIDERYRAALVALRDSQWQEAARHLLTIAITDPAYRDIDRVLKVLERTRGTSYWCAAFDVAHSQEDQAAAHAALDHLAKINPDYPQLAAMRNMLTGDTPIPQDPFAGLFGTEEDSPDVDPFETWSLLPEPTDEDGADELPQPHLETSEPPVHTQRESTDPIRKLDLDPLTELLLTDDWIATSNPPAQPNTSVDTDQPPADHAPTEPANSQPNAAPTVEPDAHPEETPSTQHNPVTDPKVILPPELPTEPEGDFIRLTPTVPPPNKEPSMATEQIEAPETSATASTTDTAPHRYSPLQAMGILAFPLLLALVVLYVLFGQGSPTLIDMLNSAQDASAINSAADLVATVDDILSQDMASTASLAQLGGVTEVIAEESPELQTALDGWIESAGELLTTREDWQIACQNEGSAACVDARTQLTTAEEAAQQARTTACELIECPEAPQTSSQS